MCSLKDCPFLPPPHHLQDEKWVLGSQGPLSNLRSLNTAGQRGYKPPQLHPFGIRAPPPSNVTEWRSLLLLSLEDFYTSSSEPNWQHVLGSKTSNAPPNDIPEVLETYSTLASIPARPSPYHGKRVEGQAELSLHVGSLWTHVQCHPGEVAPPLRSSVICGEKGQVHQLSLGLLWALGVVPDLEEGLQKGQFWSPCVSRPQSRMNSHIFGRAVALSLLCPSFPSMLQLACGPAHTLGVQMNTFYIELL